ERILGRVRQGKGVSVLGRADQPHTWSFTGDVARMLVVAGTGSPAWGRAWHAPSDEPPPPPRATGDPPPAARGGPVPPRPPALPPALLRAVGLFSPLVRELRETEYQFRDAFVMDSSAAQETFGLKPTPWEEVVTVTARASQ